MTIQKAFLIKGRSYEQIAGAAAALFQRDRAYLQANNLRIGQVRNGADEAVVYVYTEDNEREILFSRASEMVVRNSRGKKYPLDHFKNCVEPNGWHTKFAIIDVA